MVFSEVILLRLLTQGQFISKAITCCSPGADPGFFLGGGAPLRNDVTDGEVKRYKSKYVYMKKKASSQGGGGCAPPAPPP